LGKVRNTVRAAQSAAQVSAADLENERLTEQASLAEYFFEIRGQDMLQKIYDDTVAADQKAYDLTKSLYDDGIDDQISVVEAQTALQSAQAGATNVGIARAQYEHAIAVLVGKAASEFSIPVKPMTTAPPPIPWGVPSGIARAAARYRRRRARHGRRQRTNRHRLCGFLSQPYVERVRRL